MPPADVWHEAVPQLIRAVLLAVLTMWAPAGVVAAPGYQEVGGATIDVLMTEYAFTPAEIVAQPGTVRLRIVNAGIRRHTLVVMIDGIEHASPDVRPGDAVEWQIEIPRAGRYHVWCSEYRHLEKGMGGALVVE